MPVLVIDDGSTDDTKIQALKAGAEVISHPLSKGKGAALETGRHWTKEHGFAWAITLDGDGQHAASDIPKFLTAAQNSEAKLVVGNRLTEPEKIPWVRRVVNRWMSRRISQMTGRELPDTQCGFRLIDVSVWSQLNLQAMHYEIESEMLVQFVRAGHEVAFVPIEVRYLGERSRIHPWHDTLRWFRWWRQTRLSRKRQP